VAGNLESDWGEWLKFIGDTFKSMKLVDANAYKDLFPRFYHDASAFSGVYPQFGTVFPAVGYSTQLFNQSHIKKPLLATIVPYQDGGYTDVRMYAGTTCHTGCQMMLNDSPACTETKIPPKFKYLDFGEFFEIYVIWLISLSNAYSFDKQLPAILLNMNPQQLAIVLRQDLAFALSPFVYGGQELAYDYTPGQSLIPMLFGSNAFPQAFGLPMPQILIENVRALRAQRIVLNSKADRGHAPISYYSPVLCINVGAVLPWKQQWFVQNFDGPVVSFFNGAAPTVDIDLIDGSYPQGVVNLNSRVNNTQVDKISAFVRELNTYTYTTGLLDTDDPCLVLHSLKYTRYVGAINPQEESLRPRMGFYDPSQPIVAKRKSLKEEVIYIDEEKFKVGQGVYDTTGAIVTASTYHILAPAWTNICSQWWLPVADYRQYPAQALAQAEDQHIYSANQTSNVNQSPNTTLTQSHNDYVTKMIRGRTGEDSVFENAIKEAEKYGRGGFFKTLLGPVAEMIMPGTSGLLDLIPV
jgi:hypothetical protein